MSTVPSETPVLETALCAAPPVARGIMGQAEFLLQGDPQSLEYLTKFWTRYGPRLMVVEDAIERLKHIHQFGVKRHPRPHTVPVQLGQPFGQLTPLAVHNRYEHSRMVAGNMAAILAKLQTSPEDMIVGVLGALLHDVGHCALSHDGDLVLQQFGRPGHKARAERILARTGKIAFVLAHCGLRIEEVIAVIRGKGYRGKVQTIADTMAYLETDGYLIDLPMRSDLPHRVVRSIVGVDIDYLTVDSPEPIQELLEFRAYLWRNSYGTVHGQMVEAMVTKIFATIVPLGVFDLDVLERGTDFEVETALNKAIYHPKCQDIHWLGSAYLYLWGLEKSGPKWEIAAFETEEQRARHIEQWLYPPAQASMVQFTLKDSLKKSITVRTREAQMITLQAKPEPDDIRLAQKPYYLYTFTGLMSP